MKTTCFSIAAAALLMAQLSSPAMAAGKSKSESIVYIGTYTGEKSKGIYGFRFNSDTGKLEPIGLVGETTSPSFVVVHPNRKYLYAANEIGEFNGEKAGSVTAFSIDPASGKLTVLNTVSSKGAAPCYVSVDKTGKNVLVANYTGGNVAVLPIRENGRLGEASSVIQHAGSGPDKRQDKPHAHSINMSPDNRFAVAADLGIDEMLVYKFDPIRGALTPNDPPFTKLKPGSGPRHFSFAPSGKVAYSINELASTITTYSYDAKGGVLKELQTLTTLPAGYSEPGNSTAEVQVHPSGKFVYGSNRGHDSIAVFAADPKNGTLTPIQDISSGGKVPRNFRIDPTGKFLIAANQNTNNIVVFRIDTKTGKLTPTGDQFEVGSPVCVKFY